MSEVEQLKFELFEDELLSPLRGHELSELENYVAGLLLSASTERPLGIADIINYVGLNLQRTVSERVVKETIRTLRRDHEFPILARRSKPAGYWWCSSVEDMEAFVKSFRSQAIDEMSTVSRMVKRHYPQLIGQLRFDITT
jgi:hypothetical protein